MVYASCLIAERRVSYDRSWDKAEKRTTTWSGTQSSDIFGEIYLLTTYDKRESEIGSYYNYLVKNSYESTYFDYIDGSEDNYTAQYSYSDVTGGDGEGQRKAPLVYIWDQPENSNSPYTEYPDVTLEDYYNNMISVYADPYRYDTARAHFFSDHRENNEWEIHHDREELHDPSLEIHETTWYKSMPNSTVALKFRQSVNANTDWINHHDGYQYSFDYCYMSVISPVFYGHDIDLSIEETYDIRPLYAGDNSNIDVPITREDPSESGVSDHEYITVESRWNLDIDTPFSSDYLFMPIKIFTQESDIAVSRYPHLFDSNGDLIKDDLIYRNDGKIVYTGGDIFLRRRKIPIPPPIIVTPPPPLEEEEESDDKAFRLGSGDYWKATVVHKPEFETRSRASMLVESEYFRKIIGALNNDRLNFQRYITTPFEFDSEGDRNDLDDVKLGRQSTNDMEGFEDRRVLNLTYSDTKVNGSVMTTEVGSPSLNEVKQPAGLMESQEAMLCFKRICEPMILNTEIRMYNRDGKVLREKYHRHQVNYKPNEEQTHNVEEILNIVNS